MLHGRPPHCVSKHTVKRNCDHMSCPGCARVCVVACVQVRAYSKKGLRSYLFLSCTLGLMNKLWDLIKNRLTNVS